MDRLEQVVDRADLLLRQLRVVRARYGEDSDDELNAAFPVDERAAVTNDLREHGVNWEDGRA